MPLSRHENKKKKRTIGYLQTIKYRYFIFCEGTKTEPFYFDGFKTAIKSNPIYKNLVHIEARGIGADTLNVISAAEKYVNKEEITNASIWCVYDKDSFPSEDFNAVSVKAASLNQNGGFCNIPCCLVESMLRILAGSTF